MTAAVSVPTRRGIAANSPFGMNSTSNGAFGKPYHFCIAPQVTAPAAAVRPWKLPSTATILRRPVILNASFMAFSFASAPVLMKNAVLRPSPANFVSFVAARARTASGTALLWKISACAWASSAASSRGCE